MIKTEEIIATIAALLIFTGFAILNVNEKKASYNDGFTDGIASQGVGDTQAQP